MLFLGAESDPDSSKHTGGERGGRDGGGRKRTGRRNINESGGKEKYWADVMLQMQNARAHVIGNGREGAQERAAAASGRETV